MEVVGVVVLYAVGELVLRVGHVVVVLVSVFVGPLDFLVVSLDRSVKVPKRVRLVMLFLLFFHICGEKMFFAYERTREKEKFFFTVA